MIAELKELGVFEPWALKICLLGIFVFVSCGLIGNYLVLRRLSLIGDAMSHSVLPGIVIAFVVAGGNRFGVMVGAIVAGLLTTILIEWLHKSNSRVKQDVAIGITFTTLFALGVVLLNAFAGNVHIDTDCVLFGNIEKAGFGKEGEQLLTQAGIITAVTVILIALFYKELLVASFDSTLSTSIGIPAHWVHYGLMAWLSVVVVSAFEAVGSILVVGALILPGATGLLLSERLPVVLICSVVHGILSAFLGCCIAFAINCTVSAAMGAAGFILFLLAWVTVLLLQVHREARRKQVLDWVADR